MNAFSGRLMWFGFFFADSLRWDLASEKDLSLDNSGRTRWRPGPAMGEKELVSQTLFFFSFLFFPSSLSVLQVVLRAWEWKMEMGGGSIKVEFSLFSRFSLLPSFIEPPNVEAFLLPR